MGCTIDAIEKIKPRGTQGTRGEYIICVFPRAPVCLNIVKNNMRVCPWAPQRLK